MDPQRSTVTASAVPDAAALDRQPQSSNVVMTTGRASIPTARPARRVRRRIGLLALCAAILAALGYFALERHAGRLDLRSVPAVPPEIARWLPNAIRIAGMADAQARRQAIWSQALSGEKLDAVMPDSVVDAPERMFPAALAEEQKELRIKLPLGF